MTPSNTYAMQELPGEGSSDAPKPVSNEGSSDAPKPVSNEGLSVAPKPVSKAKVNQKVVDSKQLLESVSMIVDLLQSRLIRSYLA